MKLGMVGLGRMGGNMTERLRRAGHEVETYALEAPDRTAGSLEELVARLDPPRVVWLMIPAGDPTEATVQTLLELLGEGDTVVDGGNSYFRDSIRRAGEAKARGVLFLDVGVSGGIWGLAEGYCLMVGGAEAGYRALEPALATLAPEGGYAHVGPSGAGHFVKMVHNGIEYGLMEAYAEGFELLRGLPDFDLDLAQVAELWRHGSVVRSWLLDLLVRALEADPGLESIRGYVQDSGEGRWTIHEAIEAAVPVPVLALALFARFSSRQDESFAAKVNASLRQQFGGHAVEAAKAKARAEASE
ncbi:MAG TPA: decarboxylating 6-phosphogluconate dehydrogenase [Gaiellaceae bacterium]|nr:decarboxylating 6-phosphogluconate dehydrogenase [Gaiellaceae bacterium]